jgi:hypothetical protein
MSVAPLGGKASRSKAGDEQMAIGLEAREPRQRIGRRRRATGQGGEFVRGLAKTCTLLVGIAALSAVWAGPASAACPNEAIRQEEQANFLPECRAYEQVSPTSKEGASVFQASFDAAIGKPPKTSAAAVAESGNAVTYSMTGAAQDAEAAPVWNFLSSTRAANWQSRSIASNQYPWPSIPFQSTTLALSADQSKAFTYSELALAPGAVAGNGNYYIRDRDSGLYTLVAAIEDPGPVYGEQQHGIWVRDDGKEAIFGQTHALVPGAVQGASGEANLYRWSGGELHLLNTPGWLANPTLLRDSRSRAVSKDGSRVFFVQSNGSEEGLFMSQDSKLPSPISVSRRPGDPITPQRTESPVANADGSAVFFISGVPLTPGAEPSLGSLYRYDVDTDDLTLVSPNALPEEGGPRVVWGPGSNQPLAVSEDGTFVYFTARSVLAPGGQSTQENIYGWHAGETRLVASVSGLKSNEAAFSLSPDGRTLLFTSYAPLTGYDNVGSLEACGRFELGEDADQSCQEVFLYDWDVEELTCLSCPADGAAPAGHAAIGGIRQMTLDGSQEIAPRAVTDSGLAFFDTPQRLLPSDTNGLRDAYLYKAGQLHLLSTGRYPGNAYFHGASLEGDSAMISTAQRLVGQDSDGQIDLYDVRVGGGLSSQMTPPSIAPCTGSECRGPLAPAPSPAGIGSNEVQGKGNQPQRRAKAKKHHKKAGKGCRSRGAKHKKSRKPASDKAERLARQAKTCKGGGR